jgi:AbrB family looped-hinge helix DNA binding protein
MHGSQIGPSFRMRRAVSRMVIVFVFPKASPGFKLFFHRHDTFITFTLNKMLYIKVIPLVTVSSKYQITLPSNVREKMGINAGDKVVFIEEGGKFVLTKLSDIAGQMSEIMKDFDETEREFRKGFRFREIDINGNLP